MEQEPDVISDKDIEGLKKYAEFRSAYKAPTASKIGSIVLGVLSMLAGAVILSNTFNIFGLLFLVFGTVILIIGVWLILSPSYWGLLVGGIIILLLGVMNTATTLLNAQVSGSTNNLVLGYSVFLIGWGIFTIVRFRHNIKSVTTLTKIESEYYQKIAASLYALTPSEYTDMFRFDASQIWKGTFSGDTVICMSSKKDIILVPRDKFCFVVGEKSRSGENEATMFVDQKRLKGYISDSSIENYEAWISENKSAETA